MSNFERAAFGNKDGSHQLLSSSLPARSAVLEKLRFFVDRPAGHIDPSVRWFPYWGCQRVGDWWTLWRGEEDRDAPRRNMVRVELILLPVTAAEEFNDIGVLLAALGHTNSDTGNDFALAGALVQRLASTGAPVAIPDITVAPNLLTALWPRLWPEARRDLSLRTVFTSESLDLSSPPKIAVFPAELLPRWRGPQVLKQVDDDPRRASKWFSGCSSPQFERLLQANLRSLPGDFSVLVRLERIAERLERLHAGDGTLADALVVVRTQEAFEAGLRLPEQDASVVGETLHQLAGGSAEDVRTASLTRLDHIPNRDGVVSALATWVETRITQVNDQDALWILQHHLSPKHADWWKEGICRGLTTVFRRRRDAVSEAFWRWYNRQASSLEWLERYLDGTAAQEQWLASVAPDLANTEQLERGIALCAEKDWAVLLATIMRGKPLTDVVDAMRDNVRNSDAGIDAMLAGRSDTEIVVAAASTGWAPLLEKAAALTRSRPQLFGSVLDCRELPSLLLAHVRDGGRFPQELMNRGFLKRLFEGLLAQETKAIKIAAHLPPMAGVFMLDDVEAETLLARVDAGVRARAAEQWWTRFLADETVAPPPAPLKAVIIESAPSRIKGRTMMLITRLLELIPEITEDTFTEWMRDTEFFWVEGDHQRIASILSTRGWRSATLAFRRSWKHELKLVAWHARAMLSWSDGFWWPPAGATTISAPARPNEVRTNMKITFLASNPTSSGRLALDEEARVIEEKIRNSKHSDLVSFRTRWAVRPEDLQQALLEDEPVVVHFSGHGGGAVGIVLHSQDRDDERLVTEDALADLFRVLRDNIRVVVLNACYSEVQAKAIVQEIDFVVGMSESVDDDAARVFAAAFYRGLAFGRSVQTAFELGVNELRLVGLRDEGEIPRLLVRDGIDANKTRLVGGGVCQGSDHLIASRSDHLIAMLEPTRAPRSGTPRRRVRSDHLIHGQVPDHAARLAFLAGGGLRKESPSISITWL